MIRVVRDSVGGQKCLIFYKNDKPILTVWDDQGKPYMSTQGWKLEGLDEELDKLISTMKAFGLTFDKIAEAAHVYCEERQRKGD